MSAKPSRLVPVSIRLLGGLLVAGLAACTAPQPHKAPVEDRAGSPAPVAVPVTPSTDSRVAAEPARAGTYVVRAGDTLIRIALEHGVSYRDLARWNGLDNPNLIEVGQVLKVVPPGSQTTPDGLSTRPVGSARSEVKTVELKPLEGKGPVDAKNQDLKRPAGSPGPTVASNGTGSAGGASSATSASSVGSTSSLPASVPAPAAAAVPAASGPVAEGEPQWAWPAPGGVVAAFDEVRNKGIGIGGKAGDAVLAAADGRVMYAGSGLRGYGNMVIIKHNDTYLSAYAHNQAVLVKEDQVVRRGQRIAEMGSSDTDQVKLHFEIRRKGSPVDPAKLLPPR